MKASCFLIKCFFYCCLFFHVAQLKAHPALTGCLQAPPFQVPSNIRHVVHVNNEPELQKAMDNLQSDSLIVLKEGKYFLTRTLSIKKSNVTLLGANNDCNHTQLIGPGMENPHYGDAPYGIWSNASGLNLAHLGVRDFYHHAVQLSGSAQSPTIYHCKLLDSGEQFIKANPISYGQGVNHGKVLYSIFGYTTKAPLTDHGGGGTGYTNGIDVHAGHHWLVKHNLFANLHTPDNADHLWNPAVLFWNGSRHTVTANNQFIDVNRAIAYGLGNRKTNDNHEGFDHMGGHIVNNMISLSPKLFSSSRRRDSDASIIVWNSPKTLIAHNTILNQGNHFFSIEARFNAKDVKIYNNLSDAPIRYRGNPLTPQARKPDISHNFTEAVSNWFQGSEIANLRVKPSDAFVVPLVPFLKAVPQDFYGKPRATPSTRIGAFELANKVD